MKPSATAQEIVRSFLVSPIKIMIDGEWVPSGTGRTISVTNPATGKEIGAFFEGDLEKTGEAITAAYNAFTNKKWRGKPPAEKAQILWRIADLIDENREVLALLEVLDGGKPYVSALYEEVGLAAESFRYYAGWCTKITGNTSDISIPGDFHCYTRREPVGVVGLITPWNGPLVIAAWKIAPALAGGCSVVIKPSELTSLATLYLGKLVIKAGLPDGVLNIVPGSGSTVGAAIVNSPLVKKVSFTGSTKTGRSLVSASGIGNLKKLTLELGGKSPVIVYRDADLEKAIPGISEGIFGNAGQVCVAGSRLFAAPEIYDELLSGLAEYAKKIKVGDGLNPETTMGPLISKEHRDRVLSYIDKGVAEGARIVTGGKAIGEEGYFIEPTILTNVGTENCVAKEEIFGPVLSVIKIDDMENVIAHANASDFGLAGSVWTENISLAHKTARDIEAGIFWINCHGIPDMAMPFGGYKQSGWGRDCGREALNAYMELKSVIAAI